MIRSGLVSITFRKLTPDEIIDWASRAGLEGIEWGGDVHVPPGDAARAREVAALTRDAGLEVAAYGSYYRLGQEDADNFERVLESAVALGTSIIRVWAGASGSAEADDALRERVAADGRRIAEMAAQADIRIALEWHGGTLTDTAESAERLLAAIDHPFLGTYWQPRRFMPFAECLRDMEPALPRLLGVHVFEWQVDTGERRPLAEGANVWPSYLRRVAALGRPMYALLEFVRDDDPEQMLQDAATLRAWLADGNAEL